MAKLFGDMAVRLNPEGGRFTRKPNISLRLIADGEPPAKLITLPGWSPQLKQLNVDSPHCELLVEKTVKTPQGDAINWRKQASIRVNVRKGRWEAGRLCYSTGEADVRRIVSTIRSFMDDGRAVLARCRDNCCICGRALTDELSRARGIGPECIRFCGSFLYQSERSIIEPEKPTHHAVEGLESLMAGVGEVQ
jgi:hypothetical protein